MLNRILVVALIAGFVSGVAITAIQLGSSIPIIQYAETFENANGDGSPWGDTTTRTSPQPPAMTTTAQTSWRSASPGRRKMESKGYFGLGPPTCFSDLAPRS